MAEKGWICLYRKIQDDWLWKDKPFSKGQAWIDLILLANHQDRKFLLGNELQEVKRGEFITSIRKLSERWGWSRNKTKMFLDLLESDQKIVKNSDTKKTTINIVKYSDYQDLQDSEKATKKPRKGHHRDTTGTRVDTNNNDNNDNNVNNDNNYIYSANPILEQTILDFIAMRKQIKKPMTDKAIELMLNKLTKLSNNENTQIKILEQSIMNCWKGIFELKEYNSNPKGSQGPNTNNSNVQKGLELLKKYENEVKEGGKSVWDV